MRPVHLYWLCYYRIVLPICYLERVWNFLYENHIKSHTCREKDDTFSFSLSSVAWKQIQNRFPELKTIAMVEERGILPFLKRNKGRSGLVIGSLMAICLYVALCSCVWDIRISGNESLSNGQIKQELARAGLTEGVLLSSLDTKAVAGDILLSSQELSFVSINLHGTVAYVRVIEQKKKEQNDLMTGGANLIASADAVIDTLSVSAGAIQVHRGQVVRKGDLLVSGITEGSDGSHIVKAEGEVYGRVKKHFEIVLPRESTIQQSVLKKTTGLSLVFFEKNINIYTNTGNLPPTYDTIYEREQLYIGESVRLPFGFLRTVAVSYEPMEVHLVDEALVSLAYRRLEAEMTRALQSSELLCKKISGYFTEDSYVLICEAECIENIATVIEFDAR